MHLHKYFYICVCLYIHAYFLEKGIDRFPINLEYNLNNDHIEKKKYYFSEKRIDDYKM